MSVGNRIRALRRSLGMSQPALAKKASVGQSTISDLENDKKSTSAANMQAIASALGTNPQYLLLGEDALPILDKVGKNSETSEDEIEIKFYDELPISCGFGSFGEVLERDAKTLKVKKQPLLERNISRSNCAAFPASGHSMLPTIKDKDIVYVDLGRTQIKDGKVFAICHGGLFKFKRLYQLPLGGVRIVSDNTVEYPEERLTAQEIIDQQFEVIGWAWSWQSMESW
ncbi:hypothetical protein F946_01072 [Acinetobacter johnsonii ANC 3681]|uniref:HTH cro/C1-type domain-containing protein n=1 Tax=Acinetobacter johnsonii ANC 3681 TaxID=1217662 RepID=N9CYV1_ACIJO|nr:S24 family peptidase [Acinetobacter johnsonii]ENV73560.1 hypothetical protein F946_01072 [Acinetobacter johnsonii ANC 3681]